MERAKRRWLRVYLLTGEIGEACERTSRHLGVVRSWLVRDEWFRMEKKKLEELWKGLRAGEFETLEKKSMEVLVDTLGQTEDLRLRAEVAMRILRSRGYMPDKAELVVSGMGGGGVKVRITEVVVRGGEIIEGEVVERGEGA